MKPLRVIIVEDEEVTARNLVHLLTTVDANITVVGTLTSVTECIDWFGTNPNNYDLIFMDIRLADGLSFEVFKATSIKRPVIFVTAYNDFAIQAFKNNGIGYILKPFDALELGAAIDKYKGFTFNQDADIYEPLAQLVQQLSSFSRSYKKSFLVHYRSKLIPIEAVKIAWFYTSNEAVYARANDDRQYAIEFSMEQLEQQTDPTVFFRANRQFIVNRNAITEVDFYFNGRLSVKVKPESSERILVSKARVPEFKHWLNS